METICVLSHQKQVCGLILEGGDQHLAQLHNYELTELHKQLEMSTKYLPNGGAYRNLKAVKSGGN